MNLLLDTHALLWFLIADPRLSAVAKAAIEDPANVHWLSPGSLFEIAPLQYVIAEPITDPAEQAAFDKLVKRVRRKQGARQTGEVSSDSHRPARKKLK